MNSRVKLLIVLILFIPVYTIINVNKNHKINCIVDKDFDLLSKIIAAEANLSDTLDMYLVGSVVLNRIDKHFFPDDIHSVISAPNQFKGYKTKNFKRNDLTDSISCNLLLGIGRDCTVLYFFNPKKAKDSIFTNRMNNTRTLKYKTSSHLFFE